MVVVVIRPLDEPAPASSVAHWAGFADNRQGEMPALRVTDSDASTGHPLASRAEDAVDLTGARIDALALPNSDRRVRTFIQYSRLRCERPIA